MARHSTPELATNIYARTRNEKLSELAERIAETIISTQKYATGMHHKYIE